MLFDKLLSAALALFDPQTDTFDNSYTSLSLAKRAPPSLPGTWTSLGCYKDVSDSRTLDGPKLYNARAMTPNLCIDYCVANDFDFAGTEYGSECYCGNKIANNNRAVPIAECMSNCAGDVDQKCGGGYRMNIYSKSTPTGPPIPTVLPRSGDWISLGCYNDSSYAGRTLLTGAGSSNAQSVANCVGACYRAGKGLAGVEFGTQCWCGDVFSNYGRPTATGCDMACSGNDEILCGGAGRMNAYNFTGNFPAPPIVPVPSLPGEWESFGCYNDNSAARTLTGASFSNSNTMTPNVCIAYCGERGFEYAGVEHYYQCFCGDTIQNNALSVAASQCSYPCSGDNRSTCGAAGRMNLYHNGPPAPVAALKVGEWDSLGCYTDVQATRTLTFFAGLDVALVNATTCTRACYNAGYPIAGMEFGSECFCDSKIQNGGLPATSGCDMKCNADPRQLCGGPNRLNVYNFTGTLPVVAPPVPGGGGDGGGPATVFPATNGLPGNWTYAGCYVDNANGRAFVNQQPNSNTLTAVSCINACLAIGFPIAGLEYSTQCFCGDTLVNGAVKSTDNRCNMGCTGNMTEACGGPDLLTVYSSLKEVTTAPVPTVLRTGLPGSWAYVGCLRELNDRPIFPYRTRYPRTLNVQTCLALCSQFGFPAAGLEYGNDCWCGDVSDVAAQGGVIAPENECIRPCEGDPAHLCGGDQRHQLYQWTGDLNSWTTPANYGRYEQLIGGIVIPLIATLGINDKVTFIEKAGTSQYANSTGAYELDLTYVNDVEKAWRPMHVKTDVFCAASIILPDKGGRQINIGGWSAISTFGVRLFTPDGAPGVKSVNDWEEDVTTLHLQDGRWYPTALIMSNGSILVVGGELESNGAPVPTLEILPTPAGGRTAKFLDYLLRTDPYNLYPYLVVLPSENIFIAYYNEARILDKRTFDTLTVLPNIPGAVNDPMAGRSYPLEGAAMILPQYAPYTDPLVILICGGSINGPGVALDNCVTLAPESPDPKWTIERMPSKRVMPCMVALPDGTFLILNGAKQGFAGFGLANDPNLSALLYDPSAPTNSRISILGNTTVARLYHSEATLLHDGRILVSGSDPQHMNPDGVTPKYPQEFRIEAFLPPYLTNGRAKPSFTIASGAKDWGYGEEYSITVTLPTGPISSMHVSLIAASSSTHGNTMGSRTLFPSVSCTATTCKIISPPNAGVCPPGWYMLFVLDGPTPSNSQWVRIGGDPARLGEWPQGSGFTRPGM